MRIRVLIVDDSAFIRQLVSGILQSDPRFEVVATARDGVEALEKIAAFRPHLVTLDVEMPRLGGLETLKEIVSRFGTPVIMLTVNTHVTLEALSLGAVDFIAKPAATQVGGWDLLKKELLQKALAAAAAKVFAGTAPRGLGFKSQRPPARAGSAVAIAASTGGPRALELLLTSLPHDLPAAVLVTQHMPPNFTKALAERLDRMAAISIREAEQGEAVTEGVAYLAPGDFHMEVDPGFRIRLHQSPPEEHVRPSANVMMRSVAKAFSNRTVGVVLTGMGRDGSAGLQEIKNYGGITLAQDQKTSVIFSMPRAAIAAGAVDRVLALEEMAAQITDLCRGKADVPGFGL